MSFFPFLGVLTMAIKDQIVLFLNEFLQSDFSEIQEFNETMLTLDSLDKMDLVYKIEDKFKISIDANVEIKNFSDLLKCIEEKIILPSTN
jgi:acyl carrier protein